jgi:hypothetical protein
VLREPTATPVKRSVHSVCVGCVIELRNGRRCRNSNLLAPRREARSPATPRGSAQRSLRLGLEPDRRWDIRLFTTGLMVSPLARQIEPIGDRQAGMMVGDRQRHRHLAIGLLGEQPAVLMIHPDRMRAFLGKPVSSMIETSIEPRRVISGTTCSRTLASSFSSDHGETATRCDAESKHVPDPSPPPSSPRCVGPLSPAGPRRPRNPDSRRRRSRSGTLGVSLTRLIVVKPHRGIRGG